jgi:hypothetical protein
VPNSEFNGAASSRKPDMIIEFAKKLAQDVKEGAIRDGHEDKGPQSPSPDELHRNPLLEAPGIEYLATLEWEPNMLTNAELRFIILKAVPTCPHETLGNKTHDQLVELIEWLIDWWLSESADKATDKVQDDDVIVLEPQQVVPKSPQKEGIHPLEPQAQQDAMFGIASAPGTRNSRAMLSPWDCFNGYDQDLAQKADRGNFIASGGYGKVYQVSLFCLVHS